MSFQDWQQAQRGQGPVGAEEFQQGKPASAELAEEISQSLAELQKLEEILAVRAAPFQPALSDLRSALEESQQFLAMVLKRQAPAEAVAEEMSPL